MVHLLRRSVFLALEELEPSPFGRIGLLHLRVFGVFPIQRFRIFPQRSCDIAREAAEKGFWYQVFFVFDLDYKIRRTIQWQHPAVKVLATALKLRERINVRLGEFATFHVV